MTTTLPIFQPLMKLEYPDYYVNYVVQHIHHHYDQKWQSNALTTELGVSESYLMRIFKTHVGITMLDYLNRYRIYQAMSLLQSGDKHYEIAHKVGFLITKVSVIILKVFENVTTRIREFKIRYEHRVWFTTSFTDDIYLHKTFYK